MVDVKATKRGQCHCAKSFEFLWYKLYTESSAVDFAPIFCDWLSLGFIKSSFEYIFFWAF